MRFSLLFLELLYAFTYHQDTDGDVTVIVNLTHGEAEMHVAGKDVAKYDGVGSAHLFPAKLFHRSGAAPRRCVKVAFFFTGGRISFRISRSQIRKLTQSLWRSERCVLAHILAVC